MSKEDSRITAIKSLDRIRSERGRRRDGLRLLVVRGEQVQQQRLVGTGSLVIGRSSHADIRIPDNTVSRRHALLTIRDRIQIEDCGSINGVWFDGRRLQPGERASFGPGNIVEVGDAMLLIRTTAEQAGAPEDPAGQIGLQTPSTEPEPSGESEPDPAADPEPVVLQSERMKRLAQLVRRIAPSDINVIIRGETGVGKEVVARLIHRFSRRPQKAFVSVNCAALSENLLESELFGHERGAFTGAEKAKPGLLEVVGHGTFLLDEVSEMPTGMQAKLLRMLEERKAVRVGGVEPYDIQARFVSITNRDLEQAIREGTFRQDLFYRLDGISLYVPPLRERLSDIEPLCRAFIRQASLQAGREREPDLPEEALDWLRDYPWPGNIRELRNMIGRAVLLSRDTITTEHFAVHEDVRPARAHVVPGDANSDPPPRLVEEEPTHVRADDQVSKLQEDLRDIEHKRILRALKQCGGNQTKAAKLLGMSRRTLSNRLDYYSIERPRKVKDKKKKKRKGPRTTRARKKP